MHAEQMHLLAETVALAPAPASSANPERHVTDTTAAVAVLFCCRYCEREKHPQVWRRTLQRRTVHTSFWNPSVRRRVDLYDRTWTTPDGRIHRGPQPPSQHCGQCKRLTSGEPIRGKYRARRACDVRCVYAKGPDCECSCAGKNHGAGHSR